MATSSLSHRESQIVGMLASGMPLKEIAIVLRLSPGGIKVRMVGARRKTGARNTYQLVAEHTANSRDQVLREWALTISRWVERHGDHLPQEARAEIHQALGSIVRYIVTEKACQKQ